MINSHGSVLSISDQVEEVIVTQVAVGASIAQGQVFQYSLVGKLAEKSEVHLATHFDILNSSIYHSTDQFIIFKSVARLKSCPAVVESSASSQST